MKTKINTTVSKMQLTLKALAVAFVLLTNSGISQSQSLGIGVGISSTVGGCGYGTIYNPSIHVSKGPVQVELAANIQKRKFNFTGAQLSLEYSIFDGCNGVLDEYAREGFQVFLFTSANYNRGAYLGKMQLKTERRVADDSQINFESLRYNSVDMTAGFGVKVHLIKGLKWVNSVGFSGWQTLKGEKATYREYSSFCLKLKSGLTYDL